MYIEQLPSGKTRYQMVFKEERTGKWKRVSCSFEKDTETNRRKAEKILNEKIRAINGEVGTHEVTLGELSERFKTARTPFWRVSTLRRYTFSLEALKTALRADTLVSKLTAHYVLERFAASGKRPTTLNEMLRTFKTLMTWAYKNDYVPSVEWLDKLDRYPEPTAREKNAGKYLERDELMALLPEMKIDVNRMLVEFLALSGLRIGEALALTKEDVDLSDRVIHVTKTRDAVSGEVLDGAKTYTSNRDVFIQVELLELCRTIRKYMMEASLQCGFRTDLFFSDFEGKPLQYARLNNYFKENCRRVLGRSLSLHSLRHTHASLMFEGGASLEAVSMRLGHSDSRITKEIYLHITERKKAEYNAQVDRIRLLD